MFTVAVLVYDLINDYNYTVVDGIYEFFKHKEDVRLIVAPVNVPHAEGENFDYQYWSTTKILQSEQIDGFCIIPNSFANCIDIQKLTEEIKFISGKPVVSISRKLDFPNCKYTYNTSEEVYDSVIDHLKNKHNCTKIGFFGAELVDAPESKERFNSFKKALDKHGLKFYPKFVFQGDFTPGTADKVISEKIKSKKDINFDALCCVNDFTCGGVLLYFERVGISCPEDLILVGYDNTDFSIKIFPKLSTIDQGVGETGTKAAELLYKTLKNEKAEDSYKTKSFPIYRQSCGCISCKTDSTSFIDWEGNFHEKDEKLRKEEDIRIKNSQRNLLYIYNMINLIDTKISFEGILESLEPALKYASFSEIMLCIYKEPLQVEIDEEFEIPETAHMYLYYLDENNKLKAGKEENKMELLKRIVPEDVNQLKNGLFFLHPIFIRNRNYGFMICKTRVRNYILSAINLKVISDIIVNAMEYSQVLKQQKNLIEKNENLSLSAKTDELTRLLNRRGFMDFGQRLIEMAVISNKKGAVFFCDLDGLKKINDTWGHETGDLAIKTEAKVLQKVFRESDLIGRLSGDEFAVIAPNLASDSIYEIRDRLKKENQSISKELGLEFVLSISVGMSMYDSEHTNLMSILKEADKELYEEKKIKHGEKKNWIQNFKNRL